MKPRVVVAMSGGVDSCVAAALLKMQGYEVIGMTMCFNLADASGSYPRCCGPEGIEDARRVAHKLEIRHYTVNMRKDLEDKVIRDFVDEYQSGRTPNPCVRCNQYLKFGALLGKAKALGARYLATGHYARIEKTQKAKGKTQKYLLKKAKDKRKDQSYFLYRLSQKQLAHTLFPLGGYSKEEVRGLAKKFALPVADKPASQEICFVPQADYRSFLSSRANLKLKPGIIVDKAGNILGRHKGIAFYTVGQREGLGLALGYPAYIAKIEARENRLILGKRTDACAREFLVEAPHFISSAPKKKIAAGVRIRYNHKEMLAFLLPSAGKIRVSFKKPQFAVTPGQAAVFYDKDIVLGGGTIARVIA